MQKYDLHIHSLFSHCGNHTVLEILQFAILKEIKIIAITDHGPRLGKNISSTFYERFINPFEDKIHLLKGMESNYTNKPGIIDTPKHLIKSMDVVLLGFHTTPHNLGIDHYTDLLVKAVSENPFIDIISHPIDCNFPLNFEIIANVCKKHGVALELNNSKIDLGIVSKEHQINLIKICESIGCSMVVNSDAHSVTEIGDDSQIRPLLNELNIKDDLIINSSLESTMDFIKKRKRNKA